MLTLREGAGGVSASRSAQGRYASRTFADVGVGIAEDLGCRPLLVRSKTLLSSLVVHIDANEFGSVGCGRRSPRRIGSAAQSGCDGGVTLLGEVGQERW